MPYSTSLTSTLLFLSLFILAFFPNIFIALLKLPLLPLLAPSPTTPPTPYHPTHQHCPCPCAGRPSPPTMSFFQKQFSLPARSRGAYLITAEVVHALPEIKEFKVGLVNLFVQHTSCALSLNENWDEDVRKDMSDALERIVPEETGKGRGKGLYRHDAEGADDMPAHIKSALIGASVTVPITDGKLAMGAWQGVWLMEFRNSKHTRNVVATIQGEKM